MPKTYEELLGLKKVELHPPRAPIISEKSVDIGRSSGSTPTNYKAGTESAEVDDSKPIIDFSYLTNNSSFQRAIMEFIKKFVPGFENVEARGSKEVMVKSFDINAQNYRECMAELKEKLAQVKVK